MKSNFDPSVVESPFVVKVITFAAVLENEQLAGLEWNKVLVLRETYLRKGRESREEQNLYYVAITRAKKHLIFVAGKDEA